MYHHNAKPIAVLFVSKVSGNPFVFQQPNGQWSIPTGFAHGVRDDSIHFIISQGSRLGLTCDIERISLMESYCHQGQTFDLYASVVCCERFWDRPGAKQISTSQKQLGLDLLAQHAISLHQSIQAQQMVA